MLCYITLPLQGNPTTPTGVTRSRGARGGENNDDVEELEDEEFDASQEKFGKHNDNYMEMEDLCLVIAWESVSLDAVADNDQTRKQYL